MSRDKPEVPIIDKLRLRAVNDPDELVAVAVCHDNEEVSRSALEKLVKLKGLMEERKIILVCSIVKETKHESVAKHALEYCWGADFPDLVKVRMLKNMVGKVRFESVSRELEKFLESRKPNRREIFK